VTDIIFHFVTNADVNTLVPVWLMHAVHRAKIAFEQIKPWLALI